MLGAMLFAGHWEAAQDVGRMQLRPGHVRISLPATVHFVDVYCLHHLTAASALKMGRIWQRNLAYSNCTRTTVLSSSHLGVRPLT
jgi:hypothetical protein